MYLEQTIEALEVQEDSGFSNDEPDAGFQADKTGQTNVNGESLSHSAQGIISVESPSCELTAGIVFFFFLDMISPLVIWQHSDDVKFGKLVVAF